jgi:hypothetical protein
MRTYIVRFTTLLPAVALTVLAACGTSEVGSDVLDDVEAGMTRASVLSVIGQGPVTATGNDTVRVVNGYRHMRYLRDGKMIEVIYYRTEPGDVKELVAQDVETPVVLADDKVLGWGWRFYVDAMKTYGLPTPLYEQPVAPQPPANEAGAGVGDGAPAR